MLRASARPTGSRLTRSSSVKLRCINLNVSTNFWNDFWGVMWNPSLITTQLNYYASVGFNCVKIYSDGMLPLQPTGGGLILTNPYPSDAMYFQRMAWFFQQCRALNLRVYHAMNQSVEFASTGNAATPAANLAIQQKVLGWIGQLASDIIVATDICNEMNRGATSWGVSAYGTATNAQAITDLSTLMSMARATVPWPLTASVFCGSPGALGSNQWLDLQYVLGCDFHDYHPYFDFNSPVLLGRSDLAILEGRSKFIGRHFLGECGANPNSQPSNASFPNNWQTQWVNGMGDHAAMPWSFGANWFCSLPYNAGGYTSAYNVLDATGANPNTTVVTGVQGWPASS